MQDIAIQETIINSAMGLNVSASGIECQFRVIHQSDRLPIMFLDTASLTAKVKVKLKVYQILLFGIVLLFLFQLENSK